MEKIRLKERENYATFWEYEAIKKKLLLMYELVKIF